ncbi:MAG: D-alanyl-D-alanine carboxypeptidase, partial [Bacteriovorax sp.]
MKMTSMVLASFLFSTFAFSSEKTDADWENLLSTNKIPAKDQAYCFTDEFGKINGENIDLAVRLASVSKLVTSLWALDTLGPNFKYNTKLFIKDRSLHIAGSFDPFMGNEKIFFLLSQLNDLGYTQFDTITFDKNLLVFPNAQGHVEEYPQITPESNQKNLEMYFNTKNWSPSMKNEYARIAKTAKTAGRMRPVVSFEAGKVIYVDQNPLDLNDGARTLTLSSPPLYKYLKEVNVESNNFVAHTVFLQLGGAQKFSEYLVDQFGLTDSSIHFWSGSGLPTIVDGKRRDNYATCSVMLNLIEALKTTSEKQGREIEDIMAVPGSDAGTFKNRIFPSDYKNAFVAKTGTLMNTSTLAGAMNTKSGFHFYGIFNQNPNIEGSKIAQNGMVKSIMTELGGPKTFNYVVEDFNTYGTDNVKNLMK